MTQLEYYKTKSDLLEKCLEVSDQTGEVTEAQEKAFKALHDFVEGNEEPEGRVYTLKDITALAHKYKEENMPGADKPYHHEAEAWAGMRFFLEWLSKNN